jgi:hypothetical protein
MLAGFQLVPDQNLYAGMLPVEIAPAPLSGSGRKHRHSALGTKVEPVSVLPLDYSAS